MKLRILEIKAHARGKIYKIGADGKIVSIVQGKVPVVITVYFPFAQRYFGGGGFYEDKILA